MAQPVPTEEEVLRPLRADARRNREAVLKAARRVFSEQGRDAQIDDVARRAKLGVGTVYRHFPTKEALLLALAAERFDEVAAFARTALERDDAWEAFASVMWHAAELHARDRAFSEAIRDAKLQAGPNRAEAAALIGRLMERAKAQGTMRPEVGPGDVPVIMCGLASAIDFGEESWQRYLTVMLDGLRAGPR
jgi:AcrR family transcriptional regulator